MEDEERIVTLEEYVDERDQSSAMILGGAENGDDKCTYPMGYLSRQAVYFCQTCYEITKKRAGICFACCEKCHADHDVVELYTKRHFRCDCGNQRFEGASVCQLSEDKDQENALNKYNHNFEGLFCTCRRPYPDPEYVGNEEMCQCIICEDWFHLEHLGFSTDFKPSDNDHELICNECVEKYPFIWLFYYTQKKIELEEEENPDEGKIPAKKPRLSENLTSNSGPESTCRVPFVISTCGVEKLDAPLNEISKLEINGLKFPAPIFWQYEWRTNTLCNCDSCKSMLKECGIDFLLNEKDTIAEYMNLGMQRFNNLRHENDRCVERMLMDLPRPIAIEFAHHFVRFKEALGEFLDRESKNGVITEACVARFFEEFRKNNQ